MKLLDILLERKSIEFEIKNTNLALFLDEVFIVFKFMFKLNVFHICGCVIQLKYNILV